MRIARIRKVHISGIICAVIAAGTSRPEDPPIIRNCRLLSRSRDRTRSSKRRFVSQDALMRLLARICKYDSMWKRFSRMGHRRSEPAQKNEREDYIIECRS